MTDIPENLASMNVDELKQWVKDQIPINEALGIITGVDPCKGLARGTIRVNTNSIFGDGEDVNPSMSLNIEKGFFYCHRTNFGGDIFNLFAGKKNIPGREFFHILDTLKNYAIRRGHLQHQTINLPKAKKQPTAHLISEGLPRAWQYFKMAMRYGYGANPKIRKAIEMYIGPPFVDCNGKIKNPMDSLYDYTAKQLGWCDLSNALVIPYGLNRVEAMELVFFVDGKKRIGAYPFKTHRAHRAFQEMHRVNGDHSFFSDTEDRPDVDLKPWPAGIGIEKPPVIDNIYGKGKAAHEILLCEGVKDAITARFHGFFSVAHHGGAWQTHKMARIHNLFLDEDGHELPAYIYGIVDSDEAGLKGGRKLQKAFTGRKNKPIIVDLGCGGLWGEGFDLTEFYKRNHADGNLGKILGAKRIDAGVE